MKTAAPQWEAKIHQNLDERKQQGLFRKRQTGQVLAHGYFKLEADESTYINFSSNDYLGLGQDETLKDAYIQGIKRYGCGSGASPLVTGHHTAHRELEDNLCQWLGFDAALLFNSGFSANQAVIHALLDRGDYLIQDKLNHASLMEAGMLSAATMKRYAHQNLTQLEHLLKKKMPNQAGLVVTEGVFSMDGDCSDLAQISQLASAHQSLLMVDDAHGFGVLEGGKGSCAKANIQPDILMVTFGKALGVQGAAILCAQQMADYLNQTARHYIYSTAMPAAQAFAVNAALNMVKTQTWRFDKLAQHRDKLSQCIRQLSDTPPTQTPIQPWIIGSPNQTIQMHQHLRKRGLWLQAIRPPTVPYGSSRLRICLSAAHDDAQLLQLLDGLAQVHQMQGGNT
ncbi:MAG: 8-amino-7-oxononanoate synthase [Vibrio sp.]